LKWKDTKELEDGGRKFYANVECRNFWRWNR